MSRLAHRACRLLGLVPARHGRARTAPEPFDWGAPRITPPAARIYDTMPLERVP
ncbi:hypothetical protein [Nonomuraea sp. NPDC050310]|uniref:hypothetical protein n=1 Tax=Nonomuraea sp. NPDC050310 TaxID=3154935 RepID=UPI0033C88ECC